jgi:hypothetical protein
VTFPPEPQGSPDQFPPQGQHYGPPAPTPAPKKKSKVGLVVGILAAVIALCCGGGIIAAVASSKSKPTATSSPASGPGAGATTGAGTQAAAPPAAAKTLLTLKGSGIKKSAIFTTGAEWTLAYTFDCKGTSGNFIVTAYDGSGGLQDILVNQLEKKGADNTPVHGAPGAHYLELNSECAWTVTVTG